jgi:hypothetical protein
MVKKAKLSKKARNEKLQKYLSTFIEKYGVRGIISIPGYGTYDNILYDEESLFLLETAKIHIKEHELIRNKIAAEYAFANTNKNDDTPNNLNKHRSYIG